MEVRALFEEGYEDGIENTEEWYAKGIPREYVIEELEYDESYFDERWKESRLIGNLLVSNMGRFYNTRTKRFIKETHGDAHGHTAIKTNPLKNVRAQQYTHRLIADAFIPNPDNYPIVRHLDDDPSNNDISNLAWGTPKDNFEDCVRNGNFVPLSKEARQKRISDCCKKTLVIDKDGNEMVFNSLTEACEATGAPESNATRVANGERKTCHSYVFRYLEDGDKND